MKKEYFLKKIRIRDNLKPEGGFSRESEVKASFRNLSPVRPVIHRIHDHLKVDKESQLVQSIN